MIFNIYHCNKNNDLSTLYCIAFECIRYMQPFIKWQWINKYEWIKYTWQYSLYKLLRNHCDSNHRQSCNLSMRDNYKLINW